MLSGALLVTAGRYLRVEFLPLVDIQEQAIRPAFRLTKFLADHVRQQLGVTRSQLVRLVGNFRCVFCSAFAVRTWIKSGGQCPQRGWPRPQGQRIPKPVMLTP